VTVFFGKPDPNHFAIWPVAKVSQPYSDHLVIAALTSAIQLGDFGSARLLNPQGSPNRAHAGPYAAPFAAPEMDFDGSWWPGDYSVHNFQHWDPVTQAYVQVPAVLSAKTNIWQVGMLMLCALRLEVELLETQFRNPPPGYSVPVHQHMAFHHPYASRPMKMRLDDDESKRYSRQLLTLVNKCLAVDAGARISPQNLLQEVQLKMVGRDGGMMTATGKFPWNHPQAIRMKLEDKYKIGKKPYKPRKLK
jgi:serine/threonine protein kinase